MNATSPIPSPQTADFRPDRLIGRWYFVAVAGVLCGLAALALSAARPQVYEAAAVLAVGIDYPRAAPLDELSENRVLDRAAALVSSDTTLTLVAEELQRRHGPLAAWSSPVEVRAHTRLDRKAAAWEFVGIAGDPEAAADIANAWLHVSVTDLDAAMDHAWQALRLQSQVIVLACSEMSMGASSDFFWECLATGPVLDEGDVEALRHELELSRGVAPIISYQPVQAAIPSSSPVVWDRAPLVAGGALAGIILGALLVLGWPAPTKASGSFGGAEGPEEERVG